MTKLRQHPVWNHKHDEAVVRNIRIVTFGQKIYVPEACRVNLVSWHHENLQHRGRDGTLKTIEANFKWPNRRKNVDVHVKNCDICQKFKIKALQRLNYMTNKLFQFNHQHYYIRKIKKKKHMQKFKEMMNAI